MSKTVGKKISEKDRKSDILKAYNELIEQIDKKDESSFPNEEREKNRKVVEKTNTYSVDSIIKEIEKFKTSFEWWINELVNKLNSELLSWKDNILNELSKLNEIKKVVAIEEGKLKKIYSIKDVAISLTSFLELVEKENKKWEEGEKEKGIKRKREEEEYIYELNKKRKEEEDKYGEKQKNIKELFENTMKNEKDEIEKKKQELKTNLVEFDELKKFREQYEQIKNKEIENALSIQKESLKKDFDTKFLIETQKLDSEKKLIEQRLTNVEDLLKQKDSQVLILKKEAWEANRKAQEIAIKIVESQNKEVKYVTWEEK